MKKLKLLAMAALMAAVMATPCMANVKRNVIVEGSVWAIEKYPLLGNDGKERFTVSFSVADIYGYDCETNAYTLDQKFTLEELKQNGYLEFPDVMLMMTDNANGDPYDEDIVEVLNIIK